VHVPSDRFFRDAGRRFRMNRRLIYAGANALTRSSGDLRERISRVLEDHPGLPWDAAVARIIHEQDSAS
jgi:hypothetical protein